MSEHDDRPMIDLEHGVSRRRFLQGTALAGVAAFLAACTGSSQSAPPSVAASGDANIPTPPPAPSATEAASPTPKPSPTGPFHWAQWPAYIDLSGKAGDAGVYAPGSSPTIEDFKKKYAVDVDYEEKIEDNKTFYATIQP
ncbi:MAG TPA: twin-arginine translocation signal domain-containing protein, partial [Candidatus Limnocylindrales bacterium]|nr:twin-arginine translocation signal domain-containing protein [Candidatus Limnocylindrales bacterium]